MRAVTDLPDIAEQEIGVEEDDETKQDHAASHPKLP